MMITWPHKKWNPFIQFDVHKGSFLPLGTPGLGLHVGVGVLAMPFWGLGEPKINACRIFADGMEVVSKGHEPGMAILPHINVIPPPAMLNVEFPLLILNSSSKCLFAVGSVVGPDGPIAVSIFRPIGINIACNDPFGLPTSLVGNWGTVELGFTWADLIAAIVTYLLDVLVEQLVEFLQKKLDELLGWLWSKLDDWVDDLLDVVGEVLEKFDNLEDLVPARFGGFAKLVDFIEDIVEWPAEELYDYAIGKDSLFGEVVVDFGRTLGSELMDDAVEFGVESTLGSFELDSDTIGDRFGDLFRNNSEQVP